VDQNTSPRPGPSGVTTVGLTSDDIRQMFDDDSEDEQPRYDIVFSEEVDDTAITIVENPRKRKISTSSDDSANNVPLAKLKRKVIVSSVSLSRQYNYKNKINANMSKQGLYQNFDLKFCPIMTQFKDYMSKNSKGEKTHYVDTVLANLNRILHYLHPACENVESVFNKNLLIGFF